MVLGEGVAYGLEPFTSRSRDVVFQPGSGAYRIRCLAIGSPASDKEARRKEPRPGRKQPGRGNLVWDQPVKIRATAMVRCGNTIFVAGSPDIVDTADPHGAWEGRKGGMLAAFAAADGAPIAEISLPAPPVWDGMAAAGGRLYLSLGDGTLVCLQ